ncbi:hypothetical protein CAEBREN_23060 [Caenorhabditis brenneri]|uniref:Amino acid transporter transmembrane domain-containing protein n=1 Tax=Caenorhabditis brenneri TaxID=135651 RepID=G0N8F3_CAEBE|nr:hypothetical protein CAEBREN_23060 [Caenorhabditis brenneri]
MTFRIVLFLLLPYILSMVVSFTLAVSSGMFVNEAVTKIIGSYESWRKVRRGIVLLIISTILGASLLLSLSHVVPSIYDFIGYIIGLRWVF